MKRMAVLVVALALALTIVVAGCSKPQQEETPAGPSVTKTKMPAETGKKGTAANPWVIGMSQCNLGEPWRIRMNDDIKKADEATPEVTVQFKDAQGKEDQQQAQVQEFIDAKVDLLIISPKEAIPLTAPVEKAMDAGIPVIVLDRKIASEKYTCFIGADNTAIGREAGKYMVKLLGGKGNVVELRGLETSTPAGERHRGFIQGIAGSGLKIIASKDCQWFEDVAQKEMATILSRYDKIDAVYGHNDPSAHGAYVAAEQEGKGREKTIKFIGIDGNVDEGLRYVKEGILAATFDYPTGGKEAIETAVKILSGEEVPKKITLGTALITPENVDQGGEPITPLVPPDKPTAAGTSTGPGQ